MTTFEVAGRNKKAAALVAKEREFGITASDARESLEDDTAWGQLSREAGVNPPSMETRRLVVERLAALECGNVTVPR